ncbi:MAG: hypothetical protein ACE5NA_03655 [Nitrospiraceae bacterium]
MSERWSLGTGEVCGRIDLPMGRGIDCNQGRLARSIHEGLSRSRLNTYEAGT